MSSAQQRILWTTSLSHGLIHVYELAVPALLILIQADFGTGDFAMGRVVGLYGLLFGLGALPAGFLVDRLGSKLLLVACLWGSALCMAGLALSPSFGWFTVCAGCLGLSLSIYHPAGTAVAGIYHDFQGFQTGVVDVGQQMICIGLHGIQRR